jgi:pyruvate formate lyase activating enzyme
VHDALFYKELKNGRLQCLLCPRYCKLKPGQHGFCYARKNVDGRLMSLVYGKPYAVNVDPIEKKPLFHFLPGSSIVSIGTAGCNMACKYCQNWDISEAKFNESRAIDLPPERVVQMAQHYSSASIAYTYNEPTIFAEYAMDTAELAHQTKIKNVMVTNGYITPEAIDEVYQHMDGANVDLKAFNEKFYQELTLSHLEPVLASLKKLKALGVWIEITTLVIPTYNDDDKEITKMCEWIIEELDAYVPIHFTAFHPDYKLNHTPSTIPGTLLKLRNLAMKVGLKYAYVGNVSNEEGSSTYCHQCKSLLIQRSWHQTEIIILKNGHCGNCRTKIPGIFN